LQSSGAVCWTLGEYRNGNIDWRGFAGEQQAQDTFSEGGQRHTRVLFDPSGAPVQFASLDAVDTALILLAHQTGELPDREAVAQAVQDGDQPLVPPDRPLLKQCLMKRVMEATFRRTTVRFFSASPLRNTSLCFFDVAQHPIVEGHVALTLDDAPCRFGRSNSRIQDVLEVLRSNGCRASFMTIGNFINGHEEDLVALLREGHELGNHGMADRPYHEDSSDAFGQAVDDCNERITRLQQSAGLPQCVKWFRAPHGKYTRSMESVLKAKQLTNVMCDTYATCPVVQDGEWIGDFLASHALPGSIILLHMPERGLREWCLLGLRRLLQGLGARGLKAVTVSELEALANSSS